MAQLKGFSEGFGISHDSRQVQNYWIAACQMHYNMALNAENRQASTANYLVISSLKRVQSYPLKALVL